MYASTPSSRIMTKITKLHFANYAGHMRAILNPFHRNATFGTFSPLFFLHQYFKANIRFIVFFKPCTVVFACETIMRLFAASDAKPHFAPFTSVTSIVLFLFINDKNQFTLSVRTFDRLFSGRGERIQC